MGKGASLPRHGRGLGLLLGTALLLSVGLSAWAQEPGYVAEIADLPLMPGLSEVEGAAVVFDKPSGRIVEAYAQGDVARAAVLPFYSETLPQLGWRVLGEGQFAREGERLVLEILPGEGPLILRFTLSPE